MSIAAEAGYDLCVREKGFRLKLSEARIRLTDTDIALTIDAVETRRPLADLVALRLQSQMGGKNQPWESLIELTFRDGATLTISSSSPWGNDDAARDPVYVAFVEDLHSRLSPEDVTRISFRRGVGETAGKVQEVAWVAFLAIFGSAGLLILWAVFTGRAPFLAAMGPLIGLVGFGWWIRSAMRRNEPGAYDPRHLPRDLYPE